MHLEKGRDGRPLRAGQHRILIRRGEVSAEARNRHVLHCQSARQFRPGLAVPRAEPAHAGIDLEMSISRTSRAARDPGQRACLRDR
jgi:hypothetical protein